MKTCIKLYEFSYNISNCLCLTINFDSGKSFNDKIINKYIIENTNMNQIFHKPHHYKITIVPIRDRELKPEKLIWVGLRSNDFKLSELRNIPNDMELNEQILFSVIQKSREVNTIGTQSRVMSPIDKKLFRSIEFNSEDTKVISNLFQKLTNVDYDSAVKMVTELNSDSLFNERNQIKLGEQSKIKRPVAIKPKSGTLNVNKKSEVNPSRNISKESDSSPKVGTIISPLDKDTDIKKENSEKKVDLTPLIETNITPTYKKSGDVTPEIKDLIKIEPTKKIEDHLGLSGNDGLNPSQDEIKLVMESTSSLFIVDQNQIEKKEEGKSLKEKSLYEIIDLLYEETNVDSNKHLKRENCVDESTQTRIVKTSDESTQVDSNPYRKFGNRRPAFFNGQSVGLYIKKVGLMGLPRYTIKHLESTTEIPAFSFKLDLAKLIKAFNTKNPDNIYKTCYSMKQICREKYLNRND